MNLYTGIISLTPNPTVYSLGVLYAEQEYKFSKM